ncbi:MAG: LLM class flavin-dependent oxidoreductase [Chromatiales bacterium]|nr:LLM class flavin-dependent oxidoreductase [Chromatiales bacterium]
MRVDVLLEPDQTPDQLVELARLCEQAGIQRMWLQNYVSCRDPFMSLMPAARETRGVGLGVCVVSPWEMHPVKMANALLTLQEASAGRAALVIGGGGEWLARLGIMPVKRVRAVREAIELVRGAVAGGRKFTYGGELYKVWGYQARFATETPAPLVYAGVNQPQMLRACAPAADGIMYSDMPRQRIADTVGQTTSALEAKERARPGYQISNIWAWHIKADRETALREARRELLLRGLLERWYLESFLDAAECDLVEKHKPAFFKAYRSSDGRIEGVPPEIVDKLLEHLTITGTPDELPSRFEELELFARTGVDEICFRLHDDPAGAIRMIGEHVVPRLDQTAAG